MNRNAIGSMVAAAALIALPAQLSAQSCMGSHALHGQGQFGAGVSFTDGAVGYGLSAGTFTRGPLFINGGYTRTDYDDIDLSGNEVGAMIGAELDVSNQVSLCPAARFGYNWFGEVPEGADLDGITLAAGMGAGRTFGDDLLFTPHGSIAVAHQRLSASVFGESITESETFGQFAAGLNVGSDRFFAGPSISFSTLDGSDPVFGVGANIVF